MNMKYEVFPIENSDRYNANWGAEVAKLLTEVRRLSKKPKRFRKRSPYYSRMPESMYKYGSFPWLCMFFGDDRRMGRKRKKAKYGTRSLRRKAIIRTGRFDIPHYGKTYTIIDVNEKAPRIR